MQARLGFTSLATRVAIRTSELESSLRAFADSLGVQFHRDIKVTAIPAAAASPPPAVVGAEAATGGSSWRRKWIVLEDGDAAGIPQNIRELLRNADVIVGADGAHSLVRKLVHSGLGIGEFSEQESLSYVVDFRYEVQGLDPGTRAPALSLFHLARLCRLSGCVAEEHAGQVRSDGVAAITLRVFINGDEYRRLRGTDVERPRATHTVPILIPEELGALRREPGQPERLEKCVRRFLNTKSKLYQEKRVSGSGKMVAIHLSVYKARTLVAYTAPSSSEDSGSRTLDSASTAATQLVRLIPVGSHGTARKQPGRAYVLVGDAACGVPFFRALNLGVLCSGLLASAVSTHGALHGNNFNTHSRALADYSASAKALMDEEISDARAKGAGLDALDSIAAICSQPAESGGGKFANALSRTWSGVAKVVTAMREVTTGADDGTQMSEAELNADVQWG